MRYSDMRPFLGCVLLSSNKHSVWPFYSRGHRQLYFLLSMVLWTCTQKDNHQFSDRDESQWALCQINGALAQKGLHRCQHFVTGWLNHADPITGLIPRNLAEDIDIWNAKDAAADNYPFMVLTASLTDSALFHGKMLEMLKQETALTSRVGQLPDTYQFSKRDFKRSQVDLDKIIFGASEYIKDGLLPLTEWLGESPWSERMLSMLDDIWLHAKVATEFGLIPAENIEVNGEMLQVLSRVYWMTDESKYLEWALRLGDYYLLGDHHPSSHAESLRLRDHGCEIISGLCELYATLHFTNPANKEKYREPLHRLLHKTLEVGRNADGLFYDVVNPQTGVVINDRIADNFGYNLNGFYTVYQLDSIEAFRAATRKALGVLNGKYRNHDWENQSADGYADAIEGALNLYNREPIPTTVEWMDSEIKVMWAKQQPDGIIEGWHGDGNFARTTIMHALWKSKGVVAKPWRGDLRLGAEMVEDTLWLQVQADSIWEGKLQFDRPRHKEIFNLPSDWPRINQFPEWYTVEPNDKHTVQQFTNGKFEQTNHILAQGLKVVVDEEGAKIKIWRQQKQEGI